MKIKRTVFSLFIAALVCSGTAQGAQFPPTGGDDEQDAQSYTNMAFLAGGVVVGFTMHQLWQNQDALRHMAGRILPQGACSRLLHWAASVDGIDARFIISLLLACGTDVDAQDNSGYTPLHRATAAGNLVAIRLLLTHGANIEAQEPGLGGTPLHTAAWLGKTEAARLLLNRGATLEALNRRRRYTPLHVACLFGKAEMAELLINRGANLEAETRPGGTLLHEAAAGGSERILELLIRSDIDIFKKTREGTALDRAARFLVQPPEYDTIPVGERLRTLCKLARRGIQITNTGISQLQVAGRHAELNAIRAAYREHVNAREQYRRDIMDRHGLPEDLTRLIIPTEGQSVPAMLE